MRVTLISKGAVAEIDTLGAQLVSYQDVVNTEYLWQGDPAYWKGQAPILFPIVGALRNQKTVIGLFHGAAWLCPAQGIYPGDYQERDGGVFSESR